MSETKLLNIGQKIKELSWLTSTNNAPLWQKSLNGQASLTQWHVKPRLNVPFLLFNVFSLIAFAKKTGKKGYTQFKKHTRYVEYKTSGWLLSTDKKCLTFKEGFAAGKFKLIGSRDLHFYAPDEIKRIRVVRRADGYYAQLCINVERKDESVPTGKVIGIDVGLNYFYTDSDGETVSNPRYLRKSEKALKRLQKQVSREEEKFWQSEKSDQQVRKKAPEG